MHIPAHDSQHTRAAAPPIASQHTECEIPPAVTETNVGQSEQACAWARDEERDFADMEVATDYVGGEERQAPSADEYDSATASDPNVSETSRPMAVEANGERSREFTP